MHLKMVGTGAVSAKENSSCLLIDNKILIDVGNGITKALMKQNVDINNIEIILITHLHFDHVFDLPVFIFTKSIKNYKTITKIYCPKGTEKLCEEMFDNSMKDGPNFQEHKKNANIEFFEFENLDNVNVLESFYVTSYVMKHGLLPVYGFTISHDNLVIGYSSDSAYCQSVLEIINKSDTLVLDMTLINGDEYHMGYDNIKSICDKYPNKKIIVTHLTDNTRKYVNNIHIKNLLVPNDGDEFEI